MKQYFPTFFFSKKKNNFRLDLFIVCLFYHDYSVSTKACIHILPPLYFLCIFHLCFKMTIVSANLYINNIIMLWYSSAFYFFFFFHLKMMTIIFLCLVNSSNSCIVNIFEPLENHKITIFFTSTFQLAYISKSIHNLFYEFYYNIQFFFLEL